MVYIYKYVYPTLCIIIGVSDYYKSRQLMCHVSHDDMCRGAPEAVYRVSCPHHKVAFLTRQKCSTLPIIPYVHLQSTYLIHENRTR